MLRVLLITTLLAAMFNSSSVYMAAVITVDLQGTGDHTEIQPAIDAAVEGDIVLVRPGEYAITEPLTFLGKAIRLRGELGADETVIRLSGQSAPRWNRAVVIFDGGEDVRSVLEGFTLTGERNAGGGVVCRLGSSPTLKSCTIAGNSSTGGGGVYCREASPTLVDCTITGNSARGHGGGVYCFKASPTLLNCTIAGNTSPWSGGIYCQTESFPTLVNCIVWDNVGGSILTDAASDVHVSYSCVSGQGTWPGKGNTNHDPLFCGWETAEVDVGDEVAFAEAFSFSYGLAARSPALGTGEAGTNMGSDRGICEQPGAAERRIRLGPGRYAISGLNLAHHVSIAGAGENDTVIDGTVLGLRTGSVLAAVGITEGTSGGIVVGPGEAPEVVDCAISGNSISDAGGGVICWQGSSPGLVNCLISANSAGYFGGGVVCWDDSSPNLVDCTISGNSACNSGGAVYCASGSSPRFASCTIVANAALGTGGGGIHADSDSSPTLVNCTIAGNRARRGGGMYLSPASIGTLTNCTIASNSVVGEGGGVYADRAEFHLTNSIVWAHRRESIWLDPGSTVNVNSSCVEHAEVWPGLNNANVDPRFEREGLFDFDRTIQVEIRGEMHVLPDYVVEAPDYHLRPGSPAVDAGSVEAAPAVDLEGNGRPCGGGVDMGAFEMGECFPVRFVRGDCNGDADVNLTDAVCTLGWLFAGREDPTCVAAVNTNGDGSVALSDAIHLLNFLFVAGESPASPFPDCAPGQLVVDRRLGCVRSPEGCQ